MRILRGAKPPPQRAPPPRRSSEPPALTFMLLAYERESRNDRLVQETSALLSPAITWLNSSTAVIRYNFTARKTTPSTVVESSITLCISSVVPTIKGDLLGLSVDSDLKSFKKDVEIVDYVSGLEGRYHHTDATIINTELALAAFEMRETAADCHPQSPRFLTSASWDYETQNTRGHNYQVACSWLVKWAPISTSAAVAVPDAPRPFGFTITKRVGTVSTSQYARLEPNKVTWQRNAVVVQLILGVEDLGRWIPLRHRTLQDDEEAQYVDSVAGPHSLTMCLEVNPAFDADYVSLTTTRTVQIIQGLQLTKPYDPHGYRGYDVNTSRVIITQEAHDPPDLCDTNAPQLVDDGLIYGEGGRHETLPNDGRQVIYTWVIQWKPVYVRPMSPPPTVDWAIHSFFQVGKLGGWYYKWSWYNNKISSVESSEGGVYGRDGPNTEVAVWNGQLPTNEYDFAIAYHVCSWTDVENGTQIPDSEWVLFNMTATINNGSSTIYSSTRLVQRKSIINSAALQANATTCIDLSDPWLVGGFSYNATSHCPTPVAPYLEIRNTWTAMEQYKP